MHRTATIQRSRLIDLNLLPAEMRPHRYPRWYAMGLAAVLTGCVLLVPAIAIQHSASQETAHLRDQLALITGQLQGTQMDIGQERGIRTEITQTEQAMVSFAGGTGVASGRRRAAGARPVAGLFGRTAGRAYHFRLQG